MRYTFRPIALVISIFTAGSINTQPDLTIEQIMQGSQFIGHFPNAPYWARDGQTFYFRRNPEDLPGADLYQWSLANQEVEKVTGDERINFAGPQIIYSQDRLAKASKAEKRTAVTNFVNEEGYFGNLNARPKVGSPQTIYPSWTYDVKVDTCMTTSLGIERHCIRDFYGPEERLKSKWS